MFTVEEGSAGGFGAYVLHFALWEGLLDRGLKIRTLTLPDGFIDQDTLGRMYERVGLDANSIVATVLSALGRGHDAAAMIA